jgi:hypothetical protein
VRPNGDARMRKALRRLGARAAFDGVLDWTRYQFDALSDPVYLPDDHLPRTLRRSTRAAGTFSRWELMRPLLLEAGVRSALDLGCNSAWFVIEMGRLGIATLGVEAHPAYHRNALYAIKRSALANVGVAKLSIEEATLGLLPRVDCVLFLSLWHHLVDDYGLEGASRILTAAWEATEKVLLFETVSAEATAQFNVPEFAPDAESWLRDYLARTCPDARIVALGSAPVAGDEDTIEADRTLFAVLRSAANSLAGDRGTEATAAPRLSSATG